MPDDPKKKVILEGTPDRSWEGITPQQKALEPVVNMGRFLLNGVPPGNIPYQLDSIPSSELVNPQKIDNEQIRQVLPRGESVDRFKKARNWAEENRQVKQTNRQIAEENRRRKVMASYLEKAIKLMEQGSQPGYGHSERKQLLESFYAKKAAEYRKELKEVDAPQPGTVLGSYTSAEKQDLKEFLAGKAALWGSGFENVTKHIEAQAIAEARELLPFLKDTNFDQRNFAEQSQPKKGRLTRTRIEDLYPEGDQDALYYNAQTPNLWSSENNRDRIRKVWKEQGKGLPELDKQGYLYMLARHLAEKDGKLVDFPEEFRQPTKTGYSKVWNNVVDYFRPSPQPRPQQQQNKEQSMFQPSQPQGVQSAVNVLPPSQGNPKGSPLGYALGLGLGLTTGNWGPLIGQVAGPTGQQVYGAASGGGQQNQVQTPSQNQGSQDQGNPAPDPYSGEPSQLQASNMTPPVGAPLQLQQPPQPMMGYQAPQVGGGMYSSPYINPYQWWGA